MSFLLQTKTTTPSVPAVNKSIIYTDTADYRTKQIDDKGLISVLNNIGLLSRNIVTNGGFNIQQKVATASTAIVGVSTTTRAGVVADRWSVTTSVASGINWAQIDTANSSETGLTSKNYGSIIASTAGKKVMLSQFIINSEMAHLRGQKVRLSFKHSQKVGAGNTYKIGLLQIGSAGTVDVCPAFLSSAWSTTNSVDPVWGTNLSPITPDTSPTGENGTITGNYLNVVSSTSTWIRSSAVFTIPTTAKNLVAVFFSDTTGGTTDNLSFAEVQLTQGVDIVEYVEKPIAETLLRCQRFYNKSFPLTTVPAASLAVATAGNGETSTIGKVGALALASFINIKFPVKMFRTPTLTLFGVTLAGNAPCRISGAASAVQTAPVVTGLLDTGAVVSSTGDALGVAGDLVAVHYTAEAEYIN
jgi:hypothetical protein